MKIQQGYIVYQIPAEEIVKLREADCFGNLCDSCNQTIEDTYYIPVLNWGMCKKCFDEWKETAIFYGYLSTVCCDIAFFIKRIQILKN